MSGNTKGNDMTNTYTMSLGAYLLDTVEATSPFWAMIEFLRKGIETGFLYENGKHIRTLVNGVITKTVIDGVEHDVINGVIQ